MKLLVALGYDVSVRIQRSGSATEEFELGGSI